MDDIQKHIDAARARLNEAIAKGDRERTAELQIEIDAFEAVKAKFSKVERFIERAEREGHNWT